MDLTELLVQEVAALEEVLATLHAERAALDGRAADALVAATNAKAEAVAKATRLDDERKVHVVTGPEVDGQLRKLKGLAAACRQQNEANGQLIRGQRRRIEGSLSVLRGGPATADTYGRDGETRHGQGSRSHLASY